MHKVCSLIIDWHWLVLWWSHTSKKQVIINVFQRLQQSVDYKYYIDLDILLYFSVLWWYTLLIISGNWCGLSSWVVTYCFITQISSLPVWRNILSSIFVIKIRLSHYVWDSCFWGRISTLPLLVSRSPDWYNETMRVDRPFARNLFRFLQTISTIMIIIVAAMNTIGMITPEREQYWLINDSFELSLLYTCCDDSSIGTTRRRDTITSCWLLGDCNDNMHTYWSA